MAVTVKLMLDGQHSILLTPFDAVYVDIPKVASSSVKATLAACLGLESPGGNPHNVRFPRPKQIDRDAERAHPDLYSFAFVRNPWDRLVSCYRDKILGEVTDFTGFAESGVAHCLAGFDAFFAKMSFAEFVDAVVSIPDEQADEHFRAQSDFLCNSAGHLAVDFVGRYEHLERGFSRVVHRLGLPSKLRLPRLQAAPQLSPNSDSGYARYYTRETRQLVAQRYEQDVRLFEYAFASE